MHCTLPGFGADIMSATISLLSIKDLAGATFYQNGPVEEEILLYK